MIEEVLNFKEVNCDVGHPQLIATGNLSKCRLIVNNTM